MSLVGEGKPRPSGDVIPCRFSQRKEDHHIRSGRGKRRGPCWTDSSCWSVVNETAICVRAVSVLCVRTKKFAANSQASQKFEGR